MKLHRRGFVGTMAAAAGATALGWPQRAAWAADTGSAGAVRIAYFTDIHTRLEWDTPEALRSAADAINARSPDLVLCGGDLITEGFESAAATVAPRWDAYFENLHGRLRMPVHTAIGNHDLVAAMPEDGSPPAADPKAVFRGKLGLERTHHAFSANGIRFLVLDGLEVTGDELKYRGFVDAAQLEWLKAEAGRLKADEPAVVLTHMPLMTAFYQATAGATEPAPRSRVVVNNREVLSAFEGRNLLLVLQGHLHVNEMLRWGRTTFITGGAVCGKWWRGDWHGTPAGFGMITLAGGRVDWEYVPLGWKVRRPAGA